MRNGLDHGYLVDVGLKPDLWLKPHVGRPYRSEAEVMPAVGVSIARNVNLPDAVAGIARRIRRGSNPKRHARAGQGRPTWTVWPIAARKRATPVGRPCRSEAEAMPAVGVSTAHDVNHPDAIAGIARRIRRESNPKGHAHAGQGRPTPVRPYSVAPGVGRTSVRQSVSAGTAHTTGNHP